MNTTKQTTTHTPGPWTAKEDEDMRPPMMSDWCISAPGSTPDRERPIARLSLQGPQSEANARLIAAAPELLAALEWTVKCVETGAWINEDGQTPDIEIIRAAIAKAKGES